MNALVSALEKKVADLEAIIQDQPKDEFSEEDRAVLDELGPRILTCLNKVSSLPE